MRREPEKFQRQKLVSDFVQLVDGAALVISIFGVLGLVVWLASPGTFDSWFALWWLYLQLAVMGAYGVSLLVRLPKALRGKFNDRNREKIDFGRMKQEVVYVNGQYLHGEYVPKSADEIAMERTIGWCFNVFLGVLIVGVPELVDEPHRHFPFWIAVGLVLLGCLGIFLMARLRTLAERVQGDLDRARAPKI